MEQQRTARLEAMIASIQKRWGTAALQPLSKLAAEPLRPGLHSGFEVLDTVLGQQGIPHGQTTEIVGRLTSGATTLAYNIMAAAQREQAYALYVDLDSNFNPMYAKKCGIDLQQLFLARPETEFKALDIARDLIEQGSVGIIVLDLGEAQPNLHDFRRLAGLLSRSGCVVLLLILVPEGMNSQTILRNSPAPLRLLVERDSWVENRRNVLGYRSSISVLGRHQAAGKRVMIDIAVDR